MELTELKKMTVPQLKEKAKEIPDLQGLSGMKKVELIQAIAKAEGIAGSTEKESVSIGSVKQEIQELKKQIAELLATPEGHTQVKRIRRKIKRLKRQTRSLALMIQNCCQEIENRFAGQVPDEVASLVAKKC